jgi:hypothetical protein
MRSSLLLVALPATILSMGTAQALDMCIVRGNSAIMGADVTAAFDVQAGQGCMSDIHPQGSLASSKISQRAQHGTVELVDKDTWTYVPTAGYRGADAFAITAEGKSIDEKPGTSVLSYTVKVQ